MWKAEIRRIVVPGPHFNGKKLGMVAHTCHPSNYEKHKIGVLWSRPA
jgi:hypothetical protein